MAAERRLPRGDQDALDKRPLPGGWAAIVLDQPPGRWAETWSDGLPGRRASGLLVGAAHRKWLPLLERKFQERQLALVEEMVASAEEVVPALERLLPRAAVLLALPDQVVLKPQYGAVAFVDDVRRRRAGGGVFEFYLAGRCGDCAVLDASANRGHVVRNVKFCCCGRPGHRGCPNAAFTSPWESPPRWPARWDSLAFGPGAEGQVA